MGRVLEFRVGEKKTGQKPQGLRARLLKKWHDFLEKRRLEKQNKKRIDADSAAMEFNTAKILVTIDYGSDELLGIAKMTHMHAESVYIELINLMAKGIVEKETGRYKLTKYGERLVDKLMENEKISEYADRYEVV